MPRLVYSGLRKLVGTWSLTPVLNAAFAGAAKARQASRATAVSESRRVIEQSPPETGKRGRDQASAGSRSARCQPAEEQAGGELDRAIDVGRLGLEHPDGDLEARADHRRG